MKFTVVSENFAKSLSTCLKAVSIKASLPVLSNILLQTDKGMVKIIATDLEKSITTWVGAKVEKEGSFTVPAKVLSDYFNVVNSLQTEVEKDSTTLVLKSEGNFAKISGISAEEFPELPEISKKDIFINVDPKVFCKSLSQVSFAAATSDSRPILTGVLFLQKEETSFVALDGFRLCEKKFKLQKKNIKEFPSNIVIPAKSALEIAKIFVSSKDKLDVGFIEKENILFVSNSETIFTTSVLDGEFPDYQKIIPKSFLTKVTIPKSGFFKALKTSLVFAGDSSKIVKLSVSEKEQSLAFYSKTDEVGENKTEIKCDIEGNNLDIHFNSNFLVDVLNNCEGDTIIMESSGPLLPALFRENKEEGLVCVLMPVKISSD